MTSVVEGVVAALPRTWADLLLADGGARPGAPRAGWGPALRVGHADCLVTVDLHAPSFRRLAAEALQGLEDRPAFLAAGPAGWEPVDVTGMSTDEAIDAVTQRLHAGRTGDAP